MIASELNAVIQRALIETGYERLAGFWMEEVEAVALDLDGDPVPCGY